MDMIQIGSAAAFDKLVQGSEKPVLVDFWATWCGPCRMLAPVIEELAAKHPEVQFAKLDVDQVPDVAMRFGVSAIPTVVLFKAGKEAQRFVGVEPKSAYEEALAVL
ncbi:thioredoxin [Acidaminococcus fermentans]|uniref:thioredoxin n=1 Tax=Acidaminococcus fermentans TaxID=905 RepID=UPI00242ED046|nr:thioredoxin [Acidaminococcus fermentans]